MNSNRRLIALPILLGSLLLSCNGDEATGPSTTIPPVGTKTVSGKVALPPGSSVNAAGLQILTPVATAGVGSDGSFEVPTPATDRPTTVIAVGAQGTPVLIATVSPGQTDSVEISAKSTAKSLAMMSPMCILTSGGQREVVLQAAESGSQFNSLVTNIEALLENDPDNTLSYESHPRIYEQASDIVTEILKGGGSLGMLSSPGSGILEENPTIQDAAGDDVTFVNPISIDFAAEIWKTGETTPSDITMIDADESFVSFGVGWPPVYSTEPTATDYALGDGSFQIRMTKGFDFSQSAEQFFDTSHAQGRASLSNAAKFILLTSDLVSGYLPDVSKLSLALNPSKTSPYLPQMKDNLAKGDVLGLLTDLAGINLANADEIANWLYLGGANASTRSYISQIFRVFRNSAAATKLLTTGDQAADRLLPFLYDLTSGEKWVSLNVTQTDGSLSQGASNQPPSRPSVVSDVNSAFVNTSISFQGVTQDPEGDSISYRFHWGDGNSSGWSPYKASGESETLPHTFTQQGVYNVVVEARDRNGGVSEQSPPFAIQISPVGSLFWHDFNADAPGLFPADPPWTTIQTSPSYLRVVNDVFFGSSGNSCAFYDFDPDLPEQETGAAYIYAQIRSNSQGSIEFAWRIADAQDAFGVRAWEEFNFTKLGYYVLFWNGQISYYENQTFKSIQAAEAGRWYTMKLDFNVIDRVYDIYVDGALKVSGVSFAGDSTNTLQLLQVVAFNDAQCRTGYIDDIRISGGTLAKVPAGIRPRVPESAARLRP